jgi:hypothetical protein
MRRPRLAAFPDLRLWAAAAVTTMPDGGDLRARSDGATGATSMSWRKQSLGGAAYAGRLLVGQDCRGPVVPACAFIHNGRSDTGQGKRLSTAFPTLPEALPP